MKQQSAVSSQQYTGSGQRGESIGRHINTLTTSLGLIETVATQGRVLCSSFQYYRIFPVSGEQKKKKKAALKLEKTIRIPYLE